MTWERAAPIGWGAFLMLGLGAAMLGQRWQLTFAGLAIGLLGLPHGAGDFAIVAPDRRAGFLLAYVGCIAAVMLAWMATPVLALASLLVLSACHFAIDGKPDDGRRGPDWPIGGFLVGGPAAFHFVAVTRLFNAATGNALAASMLGHGLQIVGLFATGALMGRLLTDRNAPGERGLWIAAVVGTLILPPLAGFATGFVLLHARAQTVERQRQLGCATMTGYLWQVAPLMIGAVGVLALVGFETLRGTAGSATFLFAGIAALATPHMLVTPLWRRAQTPTLSGRPATRKPTAAFAANRSARS